MNGNVDINIEIETWADLARLIAAMTPEQQSQRVQVAESHPDCDRVIPLLPGVAFATVGQLEFTYCRSSVDNRHRDSEFVIYVDSNPHAEDGATAHELLTDRDIYPRGHDASADWTGPAQELLKAHRGG